MGLLDKLEIIEFKEKLNLNCRDKLPKNLETEKGLYEKLKKYSSKKN